VTIKRVVVDSSRWIAGWIEVFTHGAQVEQFVALMANEHTLVVPIADVEWLDSSPAP
jgi:hypothetical protein